MEVRSVIQQIAIEHRRRYGYRRICAELRRRGIAVNHKRVARIMREDNLLAVQPRQFVVTTKSDHKLEVYLNLARRMKLTGVDQLWVADITYIRLKTEFVYLAVILDGFSRKVVGWSLERTLASRLAVAALQEAIATRKPPPGLVHHSDRGVQYASEEYVAVLEKQGMIPSMSRPANPYDNANCESFVKTLKREEIYANQYRDLDHLRANIEEFIDKGLPSNSVYSATKAAVRSFARTWATDLRSRRIRVNAVSPGSTDTPGLSELLGSSETGRQRLKMISNIVPLGSLGSPDEIANAVVFLASDDASYVTGAELFVDGGFAQV